MWVRVRCAVCIESALGLCSSFRYEFTRWIFFDQLCAVAVVRQLRSRTAWRPSPNDFHQTNEWFVVLLIYEHVPSYTWSDDFNQRKYPITFHYCFVAVLGEAMHRQPQCKQTKQIVSLSHCDNWIHSSFSLFLLCLRTWQRCRKCSLTQRTKQIIAN